MSLDDNLTDYLRTSEIQKKALIRLGLITIRDLLYHFPARYSDISKVSSINELVSGEIATIVARVVKTEIKKGWKSKIPIAEAILEDASGKIKAIWFHQAYIAKMLPVGKTVTLTGRPATSSSGEIYLANAEFDKGTVLPIDSHDTLFESSDTEGAHIPIYPESKGVSSRFLHHAIEKFFAQGILEIETDPIPAEILKKYNLPNWNTAMHWLHMPRKGRDAIAARKRFAFEEVFYIQLQKAKDRNLLQTLPTQKINLDKKRIEEFIARFPFTLTDGQRTAISHIFDDFKTNTPMSRLLEGDVGSGKTAVSAVATYAVVTSRPDQKDFGNLQVAYMAPTEILAVQHFESFIKFFEGLPIQIGLLTGKTARKFPSKIAMSRKTFNKKLSTENSDNDNTSPLWTDISKAQLLKWVANGEIPILIGTHTLIQKSVKFKHLSLVVIDEQHRFGVRQRMQFVRRTNNENLALENVVAEKNTVPKDFIYYKDFSYRLSHLIEEFFKKSSNGNFPNDNFSNNKTQNFRGNFAEILKKESISFSQNQNVGGKRKGQRNENIDFIIEDAIGIVFRNQPFFNLSDKQKFEKTLKYSNLAIVLVASENNGKIKIDTLKNPALKKSVTTSLPIISSENSFTSLNKKNQSETLHQNSQPIPHLLSMTATPIPRTLALTIYGDLDLTALSEMPSGRKTVITEITPPNKRDDVYEKIRAELASGRQVYVICPRIDEPDKDKEMAILAKSVTAEAMRLKREIFPKYNIGILHSKMSKEKKESIMQDFNDHKIDILCATSVVEVGVSVANATNIIIEGAERFGLAQLHQLRGRVLRSNHQPYCYLFTDSGSDKTADRLNALKTAKNGFELSELDLKLRGSGELSIGKQWGISDLAMEAIKNPKMVEAARTEARKFIESGEISNYPTLEKIMEKRSKELHFE